MLGGRSRREVLQAVGAAVTGSLAGCGVARRGGGSVSVTPAAVPSETPSPPGQQAVIGPDLSPRQLRFDVSVVRPFSASSTAGLEITLRNTSERRLAALAGSRFVLPFVDEDYAGVDAAGDPGLALIPADTRLIVDPADAQPQRLAALLPDEPVDGCWRLPFDWPPAWQPRNAQLNAVSLGPGEHRQHQYDLYFIDECTTGAFTFENTFDLAVGQPPGDGDLYRARLGFVLTVTETRGIRVGVEEPSIRSPPSGRGRK